MIAITGAPGTGKTAYANTLGSVIHTDDYLHLKKDAAFRIASMVEFTKRDILEGTLVPWVLREMLRMFNSVRQIDTLVLMKKQYRPLLKNQEGLKKAHDRVLDSILSDLSRQGVRITYGSIQ